MCDRVILNDKQLGENVDEISEEAKGLKFDDKLTDVLKDRDDAIGNVLPFLLIAKQQDYLVTVSELYKKHIENDVVDKFELVKLRTRRTVKELSDNISQNK